MLYYTFCYKNVCESSLQKLSEEQNTTTFHVPLSWSLTHRYYKVHPLLPLLLSSSFVLLDDMQVKVSMHACLKKIEVKIIIKCHKIVITISGPWEDGVAG